MEPNFCFFLGIAIFTIGCAESTPLSRTTDSTEPKRQLKLQAPSNTMSLALLEILALHKRSQSCWTKYVEQRANGTNTNLTLGLISNYSLCHNKTVQQLLVRIYISLYKFQDLMQQVYHYENVFSPKEPVRTCLYGLIYAFFNTQVYLKLQIFPDTKYLAKKASVTETRLKAETYMRENGRKGKDETIVIMNASILRELFFTAELATRDAKIIAQTVWPTKGKGMF